MTAVIERLSEIKNDRKVPVLHARLFDINDNVYGGIMEQPNLLRDHTRTAIFRLMWHDLVRNRAYIRTIEQVKWESWTKILNCNLSTQTSWYMRNFLEVFKREIVDTPRGVSPHPIYYKEPPNKVLMKKTPPESLKMLLRKPKSLWMTMFLEFLDFLSKQRHSLEDNTMMYMTLNAKQHRMITEIEGVCKSFQVQMNLQLEDVKEKSREAPIEYPVVAYKAVDITQMTDKFKKMPVDINDVYSIEMFRTFQTYDTRGAELSEMMIKKAVSDMASQFVHDHYDFKSIHVILDHAIGFFDANYELQHISRQLKDEKKRVAKYKKDLAQQNSIDYFMDAYTRWRVADMCNYLTGNINVLQLAVPTAMSLFQWCEKNSDRFPATSPYVQYEDQIETAVYRQLEKIEIFVAAIMADLNRLVNSAKIDAHTRSLNLMHKAFTGEEHKTLVLSSLVDEVDVSIATYVLELTNEKPTSNVSASYLARKVCEAYEKELVDNINIM